jgi:hypothetical protein
LPGARLRRSVERLAAKQLEVDVCGGLHFGGAVRFDPAFGSDADAAHSPQLRYQLKVNLVEEREGYVVERWSPLHLASASRWYQVDAARAERLRRIAELLLEIGVDPAATTTGARANGTALRCVIASANSGPSNRTLAELLLERGVIPNDHDLYLAGFAHDAHP